MNGAAEVAAAFLGHDGDDLAPDVARSAAVMALCDPPSAGV